MGHFNLTDPPFKNRKLVVGVSGGVDSTALLVILRAHPSLGPRRLVAAHVNYRLRGRASDADESHVRRLCRDLGVPLKVLRLPKRSKPESALQDWAREIRYSFFARLASRYRAWGCAVAHQRDDQAETVLDRLLRGSGLRGLSAMRPVSVRSTPNALRIWRPLLDAPRKDLEAFLRRRGIKWRTDATNGEGSYRRNRLRNDLLPLLRRHNPRVDDALVRLADTASAEDQLLDDLARRALRNLGIRKRKREAWADADAFCELPLALRRRCVRIVVEGLNPETRGLSLERIEDVRRVWEGNQKGPVDVGYGLAASRQKKRCGLVFRPRLS